MCGHAEGCGHMSNACRQCSAHECAQYVLSTFHPMFHYTTVCEAMLLSLDRMHSVLLGLQHQLWWQASVRPQSACCVVQMLCTIGLAMLLAVALYMWIHACTRTTNMRYGCLLPCSPASVFAKPEHRCQVVHRPAMAASRLTKRLLWPEGLHCPNQKRRSRLQA